MRGRKKLGDTSERVIRTISDFLANFEQVKSWFY